MSFLFTQLGFVIVTVVYYGLLFYQLRKALRQTNYSPEKKRFIFYGSLGGLLFWLALVSGLAAIQYFNDFTTLPPKLFIVLIVPLVTILWLASTKSVKILLSHIPPQNIIYLQSFRIFVEVLLWMLFTQGLLPVQMTFEGLNFDILAGISAVVVAVVISRKEMKALIVVWNIIGLALLINIVTIALLSTPLPFRMFMNDPANTIVTQFPIIWLPAVLVPLAYFLHILSIKQNWSDKKGE